MSYKDNIPEWIKPVLRPAYWFAIGVRDRVYEFGTKYRLIDPDQIYNEEFFEKRKSDPWRADAHKVSEVINNYYNPHSVIDFGCGIGIHLEYFHNNGIDVHGVEATESAHKHAVIPKNKMEKHDLRKSYSPTKSYDLVLSFEVAEHLSERYSDMFVKTLTSSGDIVIITAAEPGQGGAHHVNEQPRSFCKEKFNQYGFNYDENAVLKLRDQIEVKKTDWILDNLMVFKKND